MLHVSVVVLRVTVCACTTVLCSVLILIKALIRKKSEISFTEVDTVSFQFNHETLGEK